MNPFLKEGFLSINMYNLSHYRGFDVAVSCSCALLAVQSALEYDAVTDYGVATVSRIDKITGLFCRRASLL